MRRYFFTAFYLIFSVWSHSAISGERPELGNIVYNYDTCRTHPINVNILRLGPEKNKAFLVQILGIDHPLNGQVLVYKTNEIDPKKSRYSLLNEVDGIVQSSLIFNGEQKPQLYIRRYAGLYTPDGRLPENNKRELCLTEQSLHPHQYYRRYENQLK